jgi:hypothetical protein
VLQVHDLLAQDACGPDGDPGRTYSGYRTVSRTFPETLPARDSGSRFRLGSFGYRHRYQDDTDVLKLVPNWPLIRWHHSRHQALLIQTLSGRRAWHSRRWVAGRGSEGTVCSLNVALNAGFCPFAQLCGAPCSHTREEIVGIRFRVLRGLH